MRGLRKTGDGLAFALVYDIAVNDLEGPLVEVLADSSAVEVWPADLVLGNKIRFSHIIKLLVNYSV